MRRMAVVIVLVMALSAGCSSTSSGSDPGSPAEPKATVPAGFEDKLSTFAGDPDASYVTDVRVGASGQLVVETNLYRDSDADGPGIGLCIAAQDAGWDDEIQVLGTDGGVIASTRLKQCAVR